MLSRGVCLGTAAAYSSLGSSVLCRGHDISGDRQDIGGCQIGTGWRRMCFEAVSW